MSEAKRSERRLEINSPPPHPYSSQHYHAINLAKTVNVTNTQGINISVSGFYCLESPDKGFCYCVQMWVDDDYEGSATLTHRNWIFGSEVVRGEGVIGYFPTLVSGGFRSNQYPEKLEAGKFAYWSCSGAREDGDTMRGWMEFRRGDDNSVVKAYVGETVITRNNKLWC